MTLFYKIYLDAFNVISILLDHSSPFQQVSYSCQDAFADDVSDYLDHLIRHLCATEAFPAEGFGVSSILGTSQCLVGSCQDRTADGEALAIHTFPKFPKLHLKHKVTHYCAK
jgi:hypothetical protein